ncbi:hypothetical protein BDZ91DRAFT_776907 [Kalaharituber pfeilii]|nr:hypothetical protein BDZ91DRAFT_776907 [Kalaharituber pfeilii]
MQSLEVYSFAEISKKSFFARITLPFLSPNYKSKVAEYCILKAFKTPLEQEQDDADELHPLWRPPPVHRNFRFSVFFFLLLRLSARCPLLFRKLRTEVYHIDEVLYQEQFFRPLQLVSGLGFSGSIFFFTAGKDFIVKSIGRRFEYMFLYKELMGPLANYMENNEGSLLSEITDVLYSFDHRLGAYFGISPSHFIVMRNVLKGLNKKKGCKKWDLKPPNFFEPTRDLVPDSVKSDAAKSGLADELDEEIVLSRRQKQDLMYLLERDTEFLMKMEIIDYSLLLGRYPADLLDPPQQGSFLSGVRSADGKWIYKMCILDYLWNVKQLHPRIIRAAGTALPEQTVTAHPIRYRNEFLKMMDDYIKVI